MCVRIQQRTLWDVSNVSILYMISVSYQSSLSKEIIKLYHCIPIIQSKTENNWITDCNACLLLEATVPEWVRVSSPLFTLVQYE